MFDLIQPLCLQTGGFKSVGLCLKMKGYVEPLPNNSKPAVRMRPAKDDAATTVRRFSFRYWLTMDLVHCFKGFVGISLSMNGVLYFNAVLVMESGEERYAWTKTRTKDLFKCISRGYPKEGTMGFYFTSQLKTKLLLQEIQSMRTKHGMGPGRFFSGCIRPLGSRFMVEISSIGTRVECYCVLDSEMIEGLDTKSQTGHVFILIGGAVDWRAPSKYQCNVLRTIQLAVHYANEPGTSSEAQDTIKDDIHLCARSLLYMPGAWRLRPASSSGRSVF
ncbi:hypothetical protein Tco_0451957 [Tanacetum coccineum]